MAGNQMLRRRIKRSRELITQPLYDTVQIPATPSWTQDLTVFAASTTPGQALMRSNMEQVGLLPAPRAVLVKALSAFFETTVTGADLKTILANAACIFTVGTKDYFKGPLWMLPGGGGPTGTGTDLNTNGTPESFNVFRFQQPVEIPTLQSFKLVIKAPPSGGSVGPVAATRITFALWCTESRQVQ
jgi:hypothetical protein